MKTKTIFISLVIFLILLNGCLFTFHKTLRHYDFTVRFPDWDDFKLEKFSDGTFKVFAVDRNNNCRVLVSSYNAAYLTVLGIILDSMETTPSLELISSDIFYDIALVDYYRDYQGDKHHVLARIMQCNDASYIVQYSCKEDVFEKKKKAMNSVLDTMRCEK